MKAGNHENNNHRFAAARESDQEYRGPDMFVDCTDSFSAYLFNPLSFYDQQLI
jgi:hypothetical protein